MENNKEYFQNIIDEIKASQESLKPNETLKKQLLQRFENKHRNQLLKISFQRNVAIAAGLLLCLALTYLFTKNSKNIDNQLVERNNINIQSPRNVEHIVPSEITKIATSTFLSKKKRKPKAIVNPIYADLKDVEKTLLGQSQNLTWQEDEDEVSLPLSSQLPICEER